MHKKKIRIIYPWDDSKFEGLPADKETTYTNLIRSGIQISKWRGIKPSPNIIRSLEGVIPGVITREWQVVAGNGMGLLQALADLCPMIFSLTTHSVSFKITTDELIEGIDEGEDAKEYGTPFDTLKLVRSAGLVCWFDAGQPHRFGSRYFYKFSDLLMKRRSHDWAGTIFFVTYSAKGGKFSEKDVDPMYSKIEAALGESSMLLIREVASVKYFHSALKIPEMKTIDLQRG